jgi:hypothetical protein
MVEMREQLRFFSNTNAWVFLSIQALQVVYLLNNQEVLEQKEV